MAQGVVVAAGGGQQGRTAVGCSHALHAAGQVVQEHLGLVLLSGKTTSIRLILCFLLSVSI